MSQHVRMVTCYVCRRKKQSADLRQDEITYQVWLLVEVRPEENADALPGPVLNPALGSESAENLRERLKECLAEGLAGRVEDMVWKTADDLSEQQVADIVANLPDSMKALIEKPLAGMATEAGVSPPVATLGGDTVATLVLRPVLEPVEKAVHGLEVAGIIVGLVTGLHPLAIVCAKHLAHDKLGSVLTAGFEQLMKAPQAQELNKELSAAGDPQVRPTDRANEALASPVDHATADQEFTEPPNKVLPAISGTTGPGGDGVMRGKGAVSSKIPGEFLREFIEGLDKTTLAKPPIKATETPSALDQIL